MSHCHSWAMSVSRMFDKMHHSCQLAYSVWSYRVVLITSLAQIHTQIHHLQPSTCWSGQLSPAQSAFSAPHTILRSCLSAWYLNNQANGGRTLLKYKRLRNELGRNIRLCSKPIMSSLFAAYQGGGQRKRKKEGT